MQYEPVEKEETREDGYDEVTREAGYDDVAGGDYGDVQADYDEVTAESRDAGMAGDLPYKK